MMGSYHDIERPDFTPEFITQLKADEVFVFGSNLAGMHGGGGGLSCGIAGFRDKEIAPPLFCCKM